MKITTWNVNGLRAVLGKNFVESLAALQPDVLCLQEVRARPEQLDVERRLWLEAQYPFAAWNPASRPGYSGVATLARTQPLEVRLGLNISPEQPADVVTTNVNARVYDIDAFDAEGRVIVSRYPDFLLFNIYFPNGGRGLERVPFKLDFYGCLLDLCNGLRQRGEQVIICGDFNTSHRPIDLAHPRQNEKNTGFLPEERLWIDRYLEHDFVDVYRHLYPERVQYTWWTFISNARSKNVGWRLDYFLISQPLLDRVQDVIIHDDILGSDHCPVSLIID